jgi:hypothetical protein
MAIDNRFEEVVDGAMNFQKREIAVSDQSRPTDKSKANLEAVYPDMYQQVKSPPSSPTDKPKAHRREPTKIRTDKSTKMSAMKSTKKLTRILLKLPVESATYEVDRMVTEADFQ